MLTPDNTNIRQPTDSSSVRSFGGDQRITPPRPNQRKEFKKLLGNDDDTAENVEDEKLTKSKKPQSRSTTSTEDSEKAQAQKAPRPVRSPFFPEENMEGDEIAMAAQSTVEELDKKTKFRSPFFSAPPSDKKTSSPATASPMNVYRQVAAESKAESQTLENEQEAAWAAMVQGQGEGEVPIAPQSGTMKESKEKFTTRFQDEHPDIAYVNPLVSGQNQVNAVINQTSTTQTSSIAEIKEIIDQILDKLYTLETSGKTETIMELKNLPLFEGTRVILTEFKTATREFNIAFENLRPDAKLVLDANLGTLRQSLIDSGHAKAVHIITTTTLIEHNFVADAKPSPQQQKNEDQQREQQQRQRQRQYKEEDEELA